MLRIAQVAPLYERVPPLLYDGTERVVGCLTDELVRWGHQLTLFASGDSKTRRRQGTANAGEHDGQPRESSLRTTTTRA
jgi:hypothetical protein